MQVVGGLSIEQAKGLAKAGLRAFVISGNMGVHGAGVRRAARQRDRDTGARLPAQGDGGGTGFASTGTACVAVRGAPTLFSSTSE